MKATAAPRTLVAHARRDGRWWVFEIPELTSPSPAGGTVVAMGQARSIKNLNEAASEVAALWLDVDESAIAVRVHVELPDAAARLWTEANEAEERARQDIQEAARLRRRAVATLTEDGITQADAARALGLSPQRISQLVTSRRTTVAAPSSGS